MSTRVPGLFIVGTNTEVGKTYVASLIARQLKAEGRNVGVYKPAASGCRRVDGSLLVSDDAEALWEAAGQPSELARVCPQLFEAPLAPHLAAQAEGRNFDGELLRAGLEHWRKTSEIILVEGAGGLMSPMGENEYVADLVREFGFPMIIVAPNVLGVINQTLQTILTASVVCPDVPIAGVVLNHPSPPESEDISTKNNRRELAARCKPPVLGEVYYRGGKYLDASVDWFSLAR